MTSNGDLAFSEDAASSMTSALGKAASAIKGLAPTDPGGADLGDKTVAAAASDLFIGLNAFGQGLELGVAHCTQSVKATSDSLGYLDRQLEAAAAASPQGRGRTNPFRKSISQPGAPHTGVDIGVYNLSNPSFDKGGTATTNRSTWKGRRGAPTSEHSVKTNLVNGEQTTTAPGPDGKPVSETWGPDGRVDEGAEQ